MRDYLQRAAVAVAHWLPWPVPGSLAITGCGLAPHLGAGGGAGRESASSEAESDRHRLSADSGQLHLSRRGRRAPAVATGPRSRQRPPRIPKAPAMVTTLTPLSRIGQTRKAQGMESMSK